MATAETAATSASLNIQIDRMTEHDLLEVCLIEGLSDLSAWGWDAYHKELDSSNHNLMLVARLNRANKERAGKSIAGYVVARMVADELHINNVAELEAYRRRGIGTVLLSAALDEGACSGASVAFLEVRAGNSAAQALYERCGFDVVGCRRNYYSDPIEDALTMSLRIRPDA